jgi:transcriptional regulator with XRE-family HTH domain
MNAKSITEHRLKRGMTQVELARKSGVHPVCINQYEHGKREPRLRNLRLIARALKVRLDEISLADRPAC